MAAIISRGMGWGGEDHGNGFPDKGPVDDELWRQVGTLDFHGVARGYTDPATCASANSTAPCYIPLDQVSNIQTISFITRAMVALGYWTQQPDNDASLYPNITAASGHRQDIITYYRYLGAVAREQRELGDHPAQPLMTAAGGAQATPATTDHHTPDAGRGGHLLPAPPGVHEPARLLHRIPQRPA